MKKIWIKLTLAIALAGTLLALAACGKAEESRLGIDGYVWVPQSIGGTNTEEESALNIWTGQTMPRSFFASGEWLYYVQTSEDGASIAIYRIPQDILPDFSQSEILVSVRSLAGYTVDKNQNLYYAVPKSAGSYMNPKTSGVTLYCQSPEKEVLYELPLEGAAVSRYEYTGSLATGAEGELLFLMDGKILRIDGEGVIRETVPTDNYRDEEPWMKEYLLDTPEGTVYYVNVGQKRRVWECGGKGNIHFKEIPVLESSLTSPYLYRNTAGILVANADGTLYQYQEGRDSMKEILRWEDGGMYGSSLSEIVALDSERMLVLDDNAEGKELYLLAKTSVNDLPERERIILASLFPTDALRKAVVEFNLTNERYHVSIENYGADPWYSGDRTENAAAYTRLDTAVSAGSKGPDILDLTYLDIYQYTDKGALEDLSPYMENSSFRKEDLLDNLLESFTIDGKLACIPKYFRISSVAGRKSQVGEKSGWTLEELMELADGQPKSTVVNGQDARSMAESFLTGYYLNTFIDWENGTCQFDGEGFRTMMEWLKSRIGKDAERTRGYLPETVLLQEETMASFTDYLRLAASFQEEILLKGYPTPDGKPAHRASVIDVLSIMSHSSHKEGAWEFLNFYFSKEDDDSSYFSTRKSILQAQAEQEAEPFYIRDSEGNPQIREDGSYVTRTKFYLYVGDEELPFDCVPQEHVDALLAAIREIDFTPKSIQENAIVDIVAEEAAYFFDSSKSLDEVIAIIQSRANMVIQTSR